jgi:hypothetical protein
MSSLQRRVETFTDRLTAITETMVNLKAQLGELDRLRDRLRKAQLSARRSRLLANDTAGSVSTRSCPPLIPTVSIRAAGAGSVGKLLETAALRGQIARFLHKHKNDAGRNKALTEDTHHNARSVATALSRWDNEGGAVREERPM